MTGGGWYAVRLECSPPPQAPRGAQCGALGGLLHLVPVSGQNRISLECASAVFLIFGECHAGLTRPRLLSESLRLNQQAGSYRGATGECPQVEKQEKAALFSKG